AEGAPEPRHFPTRSAEPAAQETRLIQAAELAEQRPGPAGRAVAAFPDDAGPMAAQRGLERREQREEREPQERGRQARLQAQLFSAVAHRIRLSRDDGGGHCSGVEPAVVYRGRQGSRGAIWLLRCQLLARLLPALAERFPIKR